MTALTTALTTTDVASIIPADLLPEFVQAFEYAPPTGMSVAWQRGGQGNVPVRFGSWGALSADPATRAGGETDVFLDTDVQISEETITPALVGIRLPVSDESVAGADGGIPAGAITQLLLALVDQMDIDILADSAAATNTAGAVTRTYTDSEFRSDLAAYRALNIPVARMGTALVLHHNGMTDLIGSLHSSSAGLVRGDGDSATEGPSSGFRGTLYGTRLYESSNVPVEGAGHSGMLTSIGMGESAYGLVVQEMPSVRMSDGDEAAQRATKFYVARAWYGTGLTNLDRCLEILHK